MKLQSTTDLSALRDMCDTVGTKTAASEKSAGGTVNTNSPNYTLTAMGVSAGIGSGKVVVNSNKNFTSGIRYAWSSSSAMPASGWVALSADELAAAKTAGGFSIRTRQEPGSGNNGKWYLHTLATYDVTQYSEYRSVMVDFGTAQAPATTTPAPTLTATADNTNWATSRNIAVEITGTGTVSYRLSSDTAYKTVSFSNSNSNKASVTVSANGTYVFRMVTADDTLVETVEVSKIDRVAPVAKVEELDTQNSVATAKAGVYTKLSVPISLSDADSGLKTLQYAFTTSGSTPSSYSTADSVSLKSLTYTATQSSETTVYLHIKVTDKVNNTATATSAAYRVISQTTVDTYAPGITVSGGIDRWTNDMPTLTWQLSRYAGKQYEVTLPNGTVSTNASGTYLATKNDTYRFTVKELDYGKTNSADITIRYIDVTAPTVAVAGIPAGKVDTAQTVTLTLSDTQSGVKGGKYAIVSDNKTVPTTGFTEFRTSQVSVPVDGNGTFYIYYEAYDNAGGTVQIDEQTTAERPANTASGFTAPIVLEKHFHAWSDQWTADATHHWHECTNTGIPCTVTENRNKDGYALHTPETDDGNCTTDIHCSVCDAVTTKGNASHSFTSKPSARLASPADCQHKATYYVQCDHCQAVSDTVTVEVGEWGNHHWDTAWSRDDHNHWHKCLIAGCTEIQDNAKHFSDIEANKATYLKKAVCDACGVTYGEVVPDLGKPTLEIKEGTNVLNKALNAITFGLFFKETKEITLVPVDNETSIDKTYYYLSDKALSEGEIESIVWKEYTGAFSIKPNSKTVIYAYTVDAAGNKSEVYGSDGVVLYTDSVRDTESVTYTLTTKTDKAISVTLSGNTVQSVLNGTKPLTLGTEYTVNGNIITLTGAYLDTLSAETHTFTVTYLPFGIAYVDKAENQAPKTTSFRVLVEKKTVEQPAEDESVFTYTGDAHTYTVAASEFYTVTGNQKTAAGTHTVTVAIKEEYKNKVTWTGGSTADLVYDFVINKATVTPPAINSKVYNGETQTASVAGDSRYTVKTNDGGITAGRYDVVLRLTDGNNYQWDAVTGVNGDEITVAFAITKGINSFGATAPSISGWTYGETPSTPTASAEFGTVVFTYYNSEKAALTDKPTQAGSYFMKASVAADGNNYDAISTDFIAFSVDKAQLTVTANNHTITYGDAPANDGVIYSGFVNNENETVLGGTLGYHYGYAQYGDVGDSYTVEPYGLTAHNYEITFVAGTLYVEPLEAEIEWSTLSADELVYDANANLLTAIVKNKQSDDEVSFTLDLIGDNVNVTADGFYYVVTGLEGSDSGNYQLGAALQSPLYEVTKKELSVTANGNTIVYGELPCANGVVYSGFAAPDTEGILGGTLAFQYSYAQYDAVGDNYTITPEGLTAQNYSFRYVDGQLTVTPKEIGLEWSAPTDLQFDGTAKVPTVTATQVVNGDRVTVSMAQNSGDNVNVGSFTYQATAIDNDNYKLPADVISDSYTITARPLQKEDFTVDVSGLVYTGTAIEPTVSETAALVTENDYTVVYDNNISAGTDTAKMTLVGKNNASGTVEIVFSIEKAVPVTAFPTGLSLGTDKTLSAIALEKGYTWVAPDTKVAYGEHAYEMCFTPEDTDNYQAVTQKVSVVGLDVTAPTGTVSIGENRWNTVWNKVTFGLFFKDTQTVTVTGEDTESLVEKTEYYLASEETDAFTAVPWTAFEGRFSIDPNHNYVVYVKITDRAGNACILNSDGVVLDNLVPVLSGIEAGKTYYKEVTVTVTDANLDKVLVNGTEVPVVDGTVRLTASDEPQTVKAIDKAGNVSADVTVTVEAEHRFVWGEWYDNQDKTHSKDAHCVCGADLKVVAPKDEEIVADGLEEESEKQERDLHLIVETDHENIEQNTMQAIAETLEEGRTAEYIDITVKDIIGNVNVSNTEHVLEIPIAFVFDGKVDILVYRNHEGVIQGLKELNARPETAFEDGTVYLDRENEIIYIYSNQFSTYGVAYHRHSLAHVPEKAATKDADGNIEHWHCESCGTYFADAEGNTEIDKTQTVVKYVEIPKTGEQSRRWFWVTGLLVNGALLFGLAIAKKRKQQAIPHR